MTRLPVPQSFTDDDDDYDGPVMIQPTHVTPQQTMTTLYEVGYLAPEPERMIEETRIYLDNLIDSVWNPETGHVSKTDLTNALMNMAGYSYARGYESGWHRAVDKARDLLRGFATKGG